MYSVSEAFAQIKWDEIFSMTCGINTPYVHLKDNTAHGLALCPEYMHVITVFTWQRQDQWHEYFRVLKFSPSVYYKHLGSAEPVE